MAYTYGLGRINDENGNPAPEGFYVVTWEHNEVTDGPLPLALAKRYCRGSGHTGQRHGNWYLPVAWVANEKAECVYNPQFSVSISPAVGGWVNVQNSDSF